jgi:hypothetical protein
MKMAPRAIIIMPVINLVIVLATGAAQRKRMPRTIREALKAYKPILHGDLDGSGRGKPHC